MWIVDQDLNTEERAAEAVPDNIWLQAHGNSVSPRLPHGVFYDGLGHVLYRVLRRHKKARNMRRQAQPIEL
jgi:hypothetical protein